MAKQLNVDLRFNADTSGAKKAIADLQASLNNLMQFNQNPSLGITSEIAAANIEVNKLQTALSTAFNSKTGALDLSLLQQSLQKAGTSIGQVEQAFTSMGAAGQVAFQQFAATIAQAQVPTMRLHGLMGEMWTTLKNVARFQLSSSVIHGLVGGIQSAFTYAQNLNESLNNIRIVTGDSSEKMAQFAREANTAAKNLSSTTLDYTNASLIYYQQGLNDQQVKERTDVTVKLANVSRQSAQAVSDQMTAIWENFDTGSHSLEYFADVITALGATTASSSQEIAKGLEKFAPIAGTIGLSYETATAALATIVANTRQSADSVGTGLRTIFSRFESLKLGETLEDGVDLSKYTKALKTVGVEVLDVNGKLKDADTIIFDLADKWKLLDNTQKTALATTVGGVRQYSTLMALFNNWDDMLVNLNTARGSEGTLQSQADIFAESWEAARNRVQTAWQGLYDTLINDEAFIGMLNGIEKVITSIDGFIQGIGGAKGVVLGLSAAILTFANASVADTLNNMVYNLKSLTGIGQKETENLRTSIIEKAMNQQISSGSVVQQAQSNAMRNQLQLQQTLNLYGREYNEIQRQIAQTMITTQSNYDQEVVNSQSALANTERRIKAQEKLIEELGKEKKFKNEAIKAEAELKKLQEERTSLQEQTNTAQKNSAKNFLATQTGLQNLTSTTMTGADMFASMAAGITSISFAGVALSNTLKTLSDDSATFGQQLSAVLINFPMMFTSAASSLKSFKKIWDGLKGNAANQNLQQFSLLEKNKYFDKAGKQTSMYGALAQGTADQSTIASLTAINGLTKERIALLAAEAREEATLAVEAMGQLPPEVTKEELIEAQTEALLRQKMAMESVGKSAWASLGPYLAIAAVIAAIGVGIYAWYQYRQRDAKAAQAAAEASKALQTRSQELEQNFKNIQSAFEGYDSAVDALKECTEGTEEWNKALTNVNDEVLNILEAYPELAKQVKVSRDANGMLTFNEEDRETVLKAMEKQATQAKFASLIGAADAATASIQASLTALSYKVQNTSPFGSNLSEIATQLTPEKLLNYYGLEPDEVTEQLKQDFSELTANIPDSELAEFGSSISNLANASNQAANQIINAAIIIAQKVLGDNYSPEVQQGAANLYGSRQQAILAQLQEDTQHWTRLYNPNIVDESFTHMNDILQRYNAAMGKNYEYGSNAVRGPANNLEINLRDIATGAETSDSTSPLHLREILSTIAAYEASLNMTEDAEMITEAFNRAQERDAAIAQGLQGYISNKTFDNITRNALDRLKEQAHNSEQLEEVLRKLWGDEYVNALLEANENAISDMWETLDKTSFSKVSRKLTPTEKKYFSSKDIQDKTGDMTLGEYASIANAFKQVFQAAGEDGVQALHDIFASEDLSSEEMLSFVSLLQSFDWSTAGPDSFNMALEEAGIVAPAAANAVNQFVEAMGGAAALAGTFESAAAKYKKYHDVIDDLKLGDQFADDSEEWKTLKETGIDLSQYFTTLPNGMHMLSNGLAELQSRINELSLEQYQTNAEIASEQNSRLHTVVEHATTSGLSLSDLQTAVTGQTRMAYSNWDTGHLFGRDTGYVDLTKGETFQIEQQLQLLEAYGKSTAEWRDNLTKGLMTPEQLAAIAEAVTEVTGSYENFDAMLLASDTHLQEVTQLTQTALMNAKWFQEAIEADLDIQEIVKYAEELRKIGIFTENDIQKSLQFATSVLRQRKAISTLKSNYQDWLKVIKDTNIALADPRKRTAIEGLQSSLKDLMGLGKKDTISDALMRWITQGKNLEKVINGDKKAWAQMLALQAAGGTKLNSQQQKELESITEAAAKLDVGDIVPQDLIDRARALGMELGKSGTELQDFINTATNSDVSMSVKVDGIDQGSAAIQALAAEAASTDATITADFQAPSIEAGSQPVSGTMTITPSGDVSYTGPNGEDLGSVIGSGSATLTFSGSIPDVVTSGEVGNGNGTTTNTSRGTPHTGGGGGGGGGGGKQKKKDKPKPDRSARYHEVTRQQDQNKRRQDAATATADRTIGKIHEKQLERQIKLEEKALELSRRRLHEAQQYINEDKDALDEALKKAKVSGAKLDADGNIENYEEIIKELYEKEKKLVEKYNKGGMSDEEFEKQKKKIDEAKEAMDNYEESIDAAQEAAEAMVESIQNMIDKRLEKIKYDIEFQIKINDNDLKIMQHLFDKLDEENPHTIAQRIANLSEQSDIQRDTGRKLIEERDRTMQQIADDVATYSAANMADLKANNKDEYKKRKEELDALLLTLGLTKEEWNKLTDEEKANYLAGSVYKDQLQEISDGLLEVDANLDEITKQITDALLDALDQLYDKFTQQAEAINTLNNVLSSYSDIMDLTRNAIGAKAADAMIANLRTQKIGNLTTKTQRDYEFYNRIKQERALLAVELEREDLVGKEREAKEKMYDSLLEKEREAQQTYLSDATETLQLIQEKAEEAQEKIMENFRNAMLGGDINDIDWFNTVYDRQKTLEDSTVEDYEKLYRLSEMEHQSNKLLDNLDNPKYRKEVLEFQKKLNEQKKAGYEMSQAELTVEQKYLDLLQARIALEDAQNAKSTVRLQRDNEGNWGYVFTNDADTIEEAEAQAQKALYEYQKALDDSNNEIVDRLKDFNSELADEMDQLRDKYNRGIIKKEVFEAESERLKQLAQDQLTFYAQQYAGFASLLGMTKEEMLALYGVTDGELPDDFGKTLLARLAGYDSMEAMIEAMMSGMDDTRDGIISTEETRQAEQDALLQQMGMSLDTLISDINTQAGQVDIDIKQISTDLGKLSQDFTNTFNAGYDEAEKYWNKLPDITEDQQALLDTVGEIAEYIRDMAYAGDHEGDRTQDEQKNIVQRALEQQDGLELKFNTEGMMTKGLSANQNNNYNASNWDEMNKQLESAKQTLDDYENSLGISQEDYKDLVSTIIRWLDLQAQTASYGFGDITSGQYRNDNNDIIEQNVHIDANFPNVVSSSEIEEAFNNLVNKAAQFANRKRQG